MTEKLNLMTVTIIDDDKLSRKLLEKFIDRADFLELRGSFDNALDAISSLKSEKSVDLIFLDIEMPEMTGFEFLESLENLPQIIITSGNKNYALEAFEHDVTDYLLKPFTTARLFKAIDKAYKRFEESNTSDSDFENSFFIKSSSSLIRVNFDEILWVEALENYVVVNTNGDKYTIHFTMKAIIEKLPIKKFTRVHRSYIVNVGKIELIKDNTIIMKTNKETKTIPIAKSYKDALMNNINLVSR